MSRQFGNDTVARRGENISLPLVATNCLIWIGSLRGTHLHSYVCLHERLQDADLISQAGLCSIAQQWQHQPASAPDRWDQAHNHIAPHHLPSLNTIELCIE